MQCVQGAVQLSVWIPDPSDDDPSRIEAATAFGVGLLLGGQPGDDQVATAEKSTRRRDDCGDMVG